MAHWVAIAGFLFVGSRALAQFNTTFEYTLLPQAPTFDLVDLENPLWTYDNATGHMSTLGDFARTSGWFAMSMIGQNFRLYGIVTVPVNNGDLLWAGRLTSPPHEAIAVRGNTTNGILVDWKSEGNARSPHVLNFGAVTTAGSHWELHSLTVDVPVLTQA